MLFASKEDYSRISPFMLSVRTAAVSLLALLGSLSVLGLSVAPGVARADLRPNPSRTYVTNGQVHAVVPTASAIYIGGEFTSIGPRTGPGVGIDASTATSTGLSQVAGGRQVVRTVVPDGSGGFYVGGNFSHVGTLFRRNIAHILPNGKVDPNFRSNAKGGVVALALSGTTLYVGGAFDSIGDRTRHHVAALRATSGAVTDWNPSANRNVNTLAVSGQTVYAGGEFTAIGGESRNRIAALDANTGQATSWNPDASKQYWDGQTSVHALAVSGATVYVGGHFDSIGGRDRSNIAALDATTGQASNWDPDAGGPVYALAVSSQTVYIGGLFHSVGGQPRNHLAALDATTGEPTSWDPNIQATDYTQGQVNALAVTGQTVYAGGSFTSVGGQTRHYLAAIDATTGDATNWNPDVQGLGADLNDAMTEVHALAVSGQTVYAGGRFNSIGGQTRHNLAALDPTTGALMSWNPDANGEVDALAVSGQTIYAGGWFTSVGDRQRNHLAAVNATTGEATAWNPDPRMPGSYPLVWALTVSGQTVYVGGVFESIGGQSRTGLAAISATTGDATSWNPQAESEVTTLALSGQTLYVGGFLTALGGQQRDGIGAVDVTTGQATSWNPAADDNIIVYSIAVSGQTVYVGGDFHDGSIGGQPRRHIAALDATTGEATSWNPSDPPGARADVRALAVSGPTVYAGGYFQSIGGQSRNNIAALDATTGTATGWDPKPNLELDPFPNAIGVTALAFAPDGSLWAGGSFTGFRKVPQSGIARFAPVH